MSTAPSGSFAFSSLARRARDRFLLSDALKQVLAWPADRRALIREYYAAALDRSAVADRLTDERGAVAALLLYREALPLLVAAVALAHDPAFPSTGTPLPTGSSAWDVLVDLRQRGRLPALPKKLEKARLALEGPEALSFDRLPAQVLLDRRAVVEVTMRGLRRLVESRPPSELKGNRYARLAVAAAVVVLLGFGLVWRLVHVNLALGKPVTASSRHAMSTAPLDNSGLTNGVLESAYGIATALGPGWVQIDLKKSQKISRIEIFNRRDVDFDIGLPMTLETSVDGSRFTAVSTRTQPFSAANPWVYKAPSGTLCRYVRIRSNVVVVLDEVEVY